jgi:hypothetical protein
MYPLLRDCVFDCIGVLEQCNSSKLRQLARLHLLTEVRRRSFYGLRTIAKYLLSLWTKMPSGYAQRFWGRN